MSSLRVRGAACVQRKSYCSSSGHSEHKHREHAGKHRHGIYVDVVASKRGFLRGGQLASSGGGIAAGCVALTLPQVRYCARETARERRR